MLSLLFLVLLIVGLLVSLLGLLGWRRSFRPGSQASPDASGHIVRLLPIALGVGAAVFGLAGLVLGQLANLGPGATVIWALATGLLAGFVVQAVLYYRLLRDETAATDETDSAAGLPATVVITIPGNGIGQIAYEHGGRTVQCGASSLTFEAIPQGTTVVIERVVRRIAQVRPV